MNQGIAEPNKVAIAGGSYGGYATLVGLTFTPKQFACGVDIVGPSSLNTLLTEYSSLLGALLSAPYESGWRSENGRGSGFSEIAFPLEFRRQNRTSLAHRSGR